MRRIPVVRQVRELKTPNTRYDIIYVQVTRTYVRFWGAFHLYRVRVKKNETKENKKIVNYLKKKKKYCILIRFRTTNGRQIERRRQIN